MSTDVAAEAAHPWTSNDRDSFGARLVLVRQKMAWHNVKEAALQCRIAVETWRSWEDNRKPQDLPDACRRISAASGCDYGWLLDGDPTGVRYRRGPDGTYERIGSLSVEQRLVVRRSGKMRPIRAAA